MKLSLLAKIVAVVVFAFGAWSFVSAQLRGSKETSRSFVVTYLISRSENGQVPIVTGLAVKAVSAEGEWKQTKVRRADGQPNQEVSIRFLDKTAPFKLEAGKLEYVGGTSEAELERDRIARNPDWITRSPLFQKEGSMLGLKVYLTHQDLNDGWIEQAFSPLMRSTPLVYREHLGNVETEEEAISVQFRDVSPEEIKPPDLPISFEWLKRLEQGMLSNPENADTVKRSIAQREALAEKLRAMDRIQ